MDNLLLWVAFGVIAYLLLQKKQEAVAASTTPDPATQEPPGPLTLEEKMAQVGVGLMQEPWEELRHGH